jgi:hypothetical protein
MLLSMLIMLLSFSVVGITLPNIVLKVRVYWRQKVVEVVGCKSLAKKVAF